MIDIHPPQKSDHTWPETVCTVDAIPFMGGKE
jgi:hypothetical protein